MSPGSIWAILGIPATQDRAAIRRAYAARLKAVNPEDDAEGFKALRGAYETALARARGEILILDDPFAPEDAFEADEAEGFGAAPTEPAALEATAETIAQPAAAGAAAVPEPARDGPFAPGERPDLAARRRLEQLLRGPEPPGDDELLSALELVLTDPALDRLDHLTAGETWLADLVVRAAPRADRLVERIAVRLRWPDNPQSPRLAPNVREAIFRGAELRYARSLNSTANGKRAIFRRLQRRPRPLDRLLDAVRPNREQRARELFDTLQHEHRGVLQGLPGGVAEAWEAYFAAPHLVPSDLVRAAALSPVLGQAVLAGVYALTGRFIGIWAYAVTLALCVLIVEPVRLVVESRGDRLWRRYADWETPVWFSVGWAPFAIGLPIAAALIPVATIDPIPLVLLAAVAMALYLWAGATRGYSPDDSRPQPNAFLVHRITLFSLAWLTGLSLGRPGGWEQIAYGAWSTAYILARRPKSLADLWYGRVGPRWRRVIALATRAAAVGLVFWSLHHGSLQQTSTAPHRAVVAAAPAARPPSPPANPLERFYPRRALLAGKSGTGVVECRLDKALHFTACKVISETPPGWGFGQAAADLAPHLDKRLPSRARAGQQVRIPIRFIPTPPPPAPGSRAPTAPAPPAPPAPGTPPSGVRP